MPLLDAFEFKVFAVQVQPETPIASSSLLYFHFFETRSGTAEKINVAGVVMTQYKKLLAKILQGSSDANIAFTEIRQLLISLDFNERIHGSHHIFTKDDIVEILNLQPKGSKAKPYQVKQVRNIILKYKLGGGDV